MKNLLIAVDVNPTDRLLLAHALKLAEKFHSKVWIVHIAAPDPDFVGYAVGPTYIRKSRAEELRDEHRKLQEYLGDFESHSIKADALLIQGPTVEMLEEEIEKLNIDLLIMGSHKHGLLYEMFVGNTAIDMIKQHSVPVMIAPLPDEG